jgi:hypothetical protein
MPTLQTTRTYGIRPLAAAIAALLLLATLAAPAMAHGKHDGEASHRGQALGRISPGLGAQLAEVRAATARYHDVEVALAEGYAPGSPCVPNEHGPGAMGIHYVNMQLVMDGELDPSQPEALLYLPAPDGRLRLVGVEYLSPYDPDDPASEPGELFGQAFTDTTPLGEQTGLHVWLWQANPAGMFAAYNPNLSCPAA